MIDTQPPGIVLTVDIPQQNWSLEQLAAFCQTQSRKTAIEAWKLGRALLLVKEKVPHGDFKPWLQKNCPVLSYTTLARYMKLARLHATPDDLAEQKVTESYQRAGITDAGTKRAERRLLLDKAMEICAEARQRAKDRELKQLLAKLDEMLHQLLPKEAGKRESVKPRSTRPDRPGTIAFTKVDLPYGWLGNMSAHPIEYEGKSFETAEHLFQWLRFDDAVIRKKILAKKSPFAAKPSPRSTRRRWS